MANGVEVSTLEALYGAVWIGLATAGSFIMYGMLVESVVNAVRAVMKGTTSSG